LLRAGSAGGKECRIRDSGRLSCFTLTKRPALSGVFVSNPNVRTKGRKDLIGREQQANLLHKLVVIGFHLVAHLAEGRALRRHSH
jgi:hypothetical protein